MQRRTMRVPGSGQQTVRNKEDKSSAGLRPANAASTASRRNWRSLEADVTNGNAGETQDLHTYISGLHVDGR